MPPLYKHTGQRPKLTSAGGLLFHHIRQSTTELNHAITEINDLQGLRRGTVTVAVIESAVRSLLPEALAAYGSATPKSPSMSA